MTAASWVQSDPDSALRWARDLPDKPAQNEALRRVALGLVDADPVRAGEVALSLTPGEAKRGVLGEVASEWARANLGGAVQWLEKIEDQPDRLAALRGLMGAWARQAPEAALSYVNGLGPAEQSAITKSLFVPWAQADPAGAFAGASALTQEKAGAAAAGIVANIWASSAPREAAEFVASLPPDAIQRSSAMEVVSEWAKRDPATAAQWAAGFPEGAMREKAVAAVARNWAEVDSATASAWVMDLPEGAIRDTALSSFARGLVESDPASAAQWAQGIAEPKLRAKALEGVAQDWLRLDPSAAKAWLEHAPLPAESKERTLNPKKG